MDSGKLRHALRIEQVSESRDAIGGAVESWAEVVTVRGSLEPLSGRELIAAAQVHAEVTARARFRYVSGVTPKMRIVFDGRQYDILSVIDSGMRHRWLELLLSEGLRDG
jgi:SPP1 family predicted phage head-tail adaptor